VATESSSPEAVRRFSLAQEAYAAIRTMIIAGEVPPGSRITVRPIVERLGLSATPVKAALMTLEREGVIESKLHRGFFVPELRVDDMNEIYEMRGALDRLAGELAASSPNRATIAAELRANCDDQRRYLETGDVDGYRRIDIEFHHNLWALCGNTRLKRTGEQLMDQMRLGNSLSARFPGRVALSLTEHLVIVDAIELGQIELAGAAAAQHIASVRKTFMDTAADAGALPSE
jgi:DNA-binding GntR family transcriptional regulator